MLKLKRLINTDQRGFTLIEMTVAIALIGLIAAGIAMTISQVMTVNSRTSSKMVALRQVQQAGDRVSKDVLQATSVQHNAVGQPFSLNLTITYFDDDAGAFQDYRVTYELAGGRLVRKHYPDMESGSPDYTNTVAQYIVEHDPENPLEPLTSFLPGGEAGSWVFTVTARSGLQTETRVYDVKQRPGS